MRKTGPRGAWAGPSRTWGSDMYVSRRDYVIRNGAGSEFGWIVAGLLNLGDQHGLLV